MPEVLVHMTQTGVAGELGISQSSAYQHTSFVKAKLKKLRLNSKLREYDFHGCTHGLKPYSIVIGAWSENFSSL